jgi:hypothetical protein
MGLTIHWSFQGPPPKADAKAVIEKMWQRAMDLPFESASEIVHFQGPETVFDRENDDDFGWLKVISNQIVWNRDLSLGRQCPAKELIGFLIDVAPGTDLMGVYLADYPKTIMVKDERTGKPRRLPTDLTSWYGSGFCKTQYASHPDCGGIRNFLRAHLSVVRLLDFAKELGILLKVTDESNFFANRDVPALVDTVGDWNAMIAATAGAIDDLFGGIIEAPITSFPDFEHLEAKGQDKIDAWLRKFKEDRRGDQSR